MNRSEELSSVVLISTAAQIRIIHVQMKETLLDNLACSVFPAPRAFPTRTLAATEKPNGSCRSERGE